MEEEKHSQNSLKGLFRIIRFPLSLFSGTNVLAGYTLAVAFTGEADRWSALIILLFASFLMYSGGLIFNDVYDFTSGRDASRNRPLPRGLMTTEHAVFFGGAVFIAALLLSQTVGLPALFVAVFIILTALLYDCWTKNFRLLGSFNMALCRGLNFVFGFTVSKKAMAMFVTPEVMFFPVLLTAYVFFLTVLSTTEDDHKGRFFRWVGGLGIAATLGGYFYFLPAENGNYWLSLGALLLCALMLLPFWLFAMGNHSLLDTKKLVGVSVAGIILLDAAVIFRFARAKEHLYLGFAALACYIFLTLYKMRYSGRTE